MAKGEISEFVAEQTKVSKALITRAVDEAFEYIAIRMAKGQRLRIPGFGTFSVIQRKARVGRNPKTGASINIPAKRTIKFKPASALQDRLGKMKV